MKRAITLPVVIPIERLEEEHPAVVGLRDSSIVTLAAHGMLDADQVAAAWRFRKAWEELVELDNPAQRLERIDYIGDALARAERRRQARLDMQLCRDLLGRHGFDLVRRICGEGWHVRDLCETRRERDTAVDVLRIHLADLAAMWR